MFLLGLSSLVLSGVSSLGFCKQFLGNGLYRKRVVMRLNAWLGARSWEPVCVGGQSGIVESERDPGGRCSFEEFVYRPKTSFDSVRSFEMRSNRGPGLTLPPQQPNGVQMLPQRAFVRLRVCSGHSPFIHSLACIRLRIRSQPNAPFRHLDPAPRIARDCP
jgi:hypothetical protein